MSTTKMTTVKPHRETSSGESLRCCHISVIINYFANGNLFTLCCIAAGLSLIAYLAAFSSEVSWILEARGELPTASYMLAAGYFIMFVATTVLIHGLVTAIAWGLLSWAIIVGSLAIPELSFVMVMTTQFWGFQSTHGLTELISYLIRLIINCFTLMCVIPTALRWRREQQMLKQLQGLASRLQLATPPPSSVTIESQSDTLRRSKKHSRSGRRCQSKKMGIENQGYMHEPQISAPIIYPYGPQPYPIYASHNEFNASIFGLDPSHYIGPPIHPYGIPMDMTKRTRSLLDLRYILPDPLDQNTRKQKDAQLAIEDDGIDEVDRPASVIGTPLNNETDNEKTKAMNHHKALDHIYYTISDKGAKPLNRNCISLENLSGATTIRNDLNSYGNNLLQNYNALFMLPGYPPNCPSAIHSTTNTFSPYYNYFHHNGPSSFTGYGGYTNPNPYKSNRNSKQSLGNESDDYRKYRDVAL